MNLPVAKAMMIAICSRMGLRATIIGSDHGIILLRIVSENFKDFSLEQRQTLLNRAFRIHAANVVVKFNIVFEALTPTEMRKIDPNYVPY